MKNKQTAVEWLVKIYRQKNKIDYFDIEQAKAMHKQQIIDAYVEGCNDSILDESTDKTRSELYYNETYGK